MTMYSPCLHIDIISCKSSISFQSTTAAQCNTSNWKTAALLFFPWRYLSNTMPNSAWEMAWSNRRLLSLNSWNLKSKLADEFQNSGINSASFWAWDKFLHLFRFQRYFFWENHDVLLRGNVQTNHGQWHVKGGNWFCVEDWHTGTRCSWLFSNKILQHFMVAIWWSWINIRNLPSRGTIVEANLLLFHLPPDSRHVQNEHEFVALKDTC